MTSAISNSPRKSATRPTIPCACTCARWAPFRCSPAKAKSSSPSATSAANGRFARPCPARRWSSARSSSWARICGAASLQSAMSWCFPNSSSPTRISRAQLNDLLSQDRRDREVLQEEPAVPPEAAGRLAPDEAEAAPRPALRPGAQHGADFPRSSATSRSAPRSAAAWPDVCAARWKS